MKQGDSSNLLPGLRIGGVDALGERSTHYYEGSESVTSAPQVVWSLLAPPAWGVAGCQCGAEGCDVPERKRSELSIRRPGPWTGVARKRHASLLLATCLTAVVLPGWTDVASSASLPAVARVAQRAAAPGHSDSPVEAAGQRQRASTRIRSALTVPRTSYVYASTARLSATATGVARGTLSFWVGRTRLCSAPLRAAHASCQAPPTSLNAGTHVLVVQLSTGARRVALSGHNTLTVLPSPVVVVLNPSVRTLAASALAQFSVTCRARTPSGRRVPGAVSLRLDSRLLSPDAGVFRFSSLGAGGVLAGPHRLTARFRGSEDYRPAAASDAFVVTPTPIATARTPTFASVIPAATGFTVQITNYDPQWSWSGDATASGVVGISVTGLVTVSGVTPDTSSILTVTTTRAGYPSASATARGTSLAQALRASLTSITGLNGHLVLFSFGSSLILLGFLKISRSS